MNAHVYIVLMCTLVAGCATQAPEPVYLTAEIPALPEQCFPDQVPAPAEPKLEGGSDVTDVEAVKDRQKWKAALRTEKSHRATCARRLDVLFPSKERGKPTS